MKSLLFSLIISFFCGVSYGQTLITPFASSTSNGEVSICQSGGEPVIVTVLGSSHLTQGFQQPELFEDIDIYIPNVFAPGSDSNNKVFKIGIAKDTPVSIDEFLIYDRWGNLVYNQTDIDPHTFDGWWDGRLNNEDLMKGVYTYIVTFTVRSDSKIAKGSITKI